MERRPQLFDRKNEKQRDPIIDWKKSINGVSKETKNQETAFKKKLKNGNLLGRNLLVTIRNIGWRFVMVA